MDEYEIDLSPKGNSAEWNRIEIVHYCICFGWMYDVQRKHTRTYNIYTHMIHRGKIYHIFFRLHNRVKHVILLAASIQLAKAKENRAPNALTPRAEKNIIAAQLKKFNPTCRAVPISAGKESPILFLPQSWFSDCSVENGVVFERYRSYWRYTHSSLNHVYRG